MEAGKKGSHGERAASRRKARAEKAEREWAHQARRFNTRIVFSPHLGDPFPSLLGMGPGYTTIRVSAWLTEDEASQEIARHFKWLHENYSTPEAIRAYHERAGRILDAVMRQPAKQP